MEAASQARKERLEALKKRRYGGDAESSEKAKLGGAEGASSAEGDQAEDLQQITTARLVRSFRNYDRETGGLKKFKYDERPRETVEEEVKGVQEAILAMDELKRKEELDLTNIAPRKPNWDLKRDMEKRLAKLERRDKEARLILIRQRLQAAQGGVDSVSGKSVSAAAANAQLRAAEAELAAGVVGNGAQLDDVEGLDSDED
ncbi:mRNA splicing factor [Ceraceosorus guamensis]|uniref:mRNA splicing factor n=1 Tax=Ceraceosorus guamensis TaxID=1522189 RepID=A0A316W5P2_9BASI|nr:mRNA splicing factor [Ceraceosorus guamensis]PWN42965.1 mRNA splicing factor [Ceraceosorus guamensis]